MIKQDFGLLIEYALYDKSNFEYVKSIICDSLSHNPNLFFVKMEHIKGMDTANLYVGIEEDGSITCRNWNNYIEINIENPTKCTWKGKEFDIGQIHSLFDSVSSLQNMSVREVIEFKKTGKYFTPKIDFRLQTESFNCNSDFLENLYNSHNILEEELDKLSLRYYDRKDIIQPIIEISKTTD